ncbi:MAG: hypothetical protein LBL97_00320, partial [Prevotellaceae bacterium]|nr:hypothetical protein [Prevotellaceae bacterium]
MIKYRLVRKVNPMKKGEPAKWYGNPIVNEKVDTRALSTEGTEFTSLSPNEFESAMYELGHKLARGLIAGNSIKINDLGTFRLSFSSDGVAEVTDFYAQTMIKDPHIIFTPEKSLMKAIADNLSYENAGVVDD